MRFRKKPVEVEACIWDGDYTSLRLWGVEPVTAYSSGKFQMRTIHGVSWVRLGDWIVKERDGSGFYPCTPEEFAATYEPVEEAK